MATQEHNMPDSLNETSRIVGVLQEGQRQVEARLDRIDENQRETNRRIDRILCAVIAIGMVVVGALIANTILA